jgi:hypothetical protein
VSESTAAVSPDVVVRVAGLRACLLDGLRANRTMEVLTRLHRVEDALAQTAAPLSDELYAAIGGLADRVSRGRLIVLRRDVFNTRRPKTGVDDRTLMALGRPLRAKLTDWHRLIEERAKLTDLACAALETERAAARRILGEAAGDPWFQQGLATASPDFTRDLLAWLESRRDPDPRLFTTLYKYVTRAATKTSPFSTFTSSAVVPWQGGPVDGSARGDRRVELNVFISTCLRDRLADVPELRPYIPVRAVTRVKPGADRVVALVSRYGSEQVISFEPTEALRAIVAEAQNGGLRPYEELVTALSDRFGGDVTAVRDYLDGLIDAGLLEAMPPVPDQDGDHVTALETYLSGLPVPAARPIAAGLRSVRRRLDEVAGATTGRARLDAGEELDRALQEVYVALGWGTQSPGAQARHLYFEDTNRVPDPVPPVADCANAVDDLTALRQVCGLYDWSQPVRSTASCLFADRFGAEATAGLLEFFRLAANDAAFRQTLERPRTAPSTGWVAGLQRRMRELVGSHPVGADGVRRVPAAKLLDFIGRATPELRSPRSVAFFGQPALDPSGRPVFVLNAAEAGHGRTAARVRRNQGTPAPVRHPGSGPLPAVIPAAAGSNVNLWGADAHAEIGYPGVVGASDATFALEDLCVTRDAVTGQLVLTAERDGRPVRVMPLHRGLMAEFLLPPLHRFLITVFGDGAPYYPRQGLTSFTTNESPEYRSAPRTAVGDVVINRATVLTRSECLPAPLRGEHGARYLSRITRWRQSLGLPENVFLRAVPSGPVHGDLAEKSRKPLYLDLTCDIAAEIFGGVAASPDHLVFIEESYPDPRELGHEGGQARATEFVIEIG